MRKIYLTTSIAVAMTATAIAADPTGRWTTIDDATGKPQSVVQIYRAADGSLAGKVVEILRTDRGPNPVCERCPGTKKNKPIRGMTILWNLKRDDAGHWSGGSVLDPEKGQTYSAKIELSGDGSRLKLRGYLGIEALGRTQIWTRK